MCSWALNLGSHKSDFDTQKYKISFKKTNLVRPEPASYSDLTSDWKMWSEERRPFGLPNQQVLCRDNISDRAF